jgi:hypothetical protein
LKGFRDIEAGSQALSVSAASSTVRVTRSALGEVRVFVRTASADGDAKGTVMGAVAAPEAAALAGNTTSVANRTDASAVTAARVAVLGPQALREIARARQEMAAEAAAALETLKAKAAEAAASEKEELTETYERLRAEAAQVAEAELDRQRELFEAKTAAATELTALFGAASVLELIFSWGGVSQFGLTAILKGDFAVVQGYVLVMSVIAMVIFAITDLIILKIEPRARSQAA